MLGVKKKTKLGTCHDMLYCNVCPANYLYINNTEAAFGEGVGVCWISRNGWQR